MRRWAANASAPPLSTVLTPPSVRVFLCHRRALGVVFVLRITHDGRVRAKPLGLLGSFFLRTVQSRPMPNEQSRVDIGRVVARARRRGREWQGGDKCHLQPLDIRGQDAGHGRIVGWRLLTKNPVPILIRSARLMVLPLEHFLAPATSATFEAFNARRERGAATD